MRSTGFPKGPSNGIVYTFGAQIPTIMVLGPFGFCIWGSSMKLIGTWPFKALWLSVNPHRTLRSMGRSMYA